MLGFADPWVAAGYWLSILATVLCVAYGVLNWNKGMDGESDGKLTLAFSLSASLCI
ncbi:MAG: symporter small accessory protein [Armatimonadota bacterium]